MEQTKEQKIANVTANSVGNGNVNSETTKCSKINIGIFFDGTFNSRQLVGTSGFDAWHTNPDFMENLYEKREIQRDGCTIRCGSVYVEGIGTSNSGVDIQGGITGGGKYGIKDKFHKGVMATKRLLNSLMDGDEQIEVYLDVFGFSRGAALARVFANEINKKGNLGLDGIDVKIRFLGLWDCVGSFGKPGDSVENDYNLSTPKAQEIVHITAEDEIRKFFPLTLTKFGRRIRLIGDHADIGGAHPPRKVNNVATTTSPHVLERIRQDWLSSDETLIEGRKTSSGFSEALHKYHWSAEFGIADVSLNLMHHLAVNGASKVPLKAIPNNRKVNNDLLKKYLNSLMGTGSSSMTNKDKQDIRHKFAHISFNQNIANAAETNAKRTVFIK